jgi:hypothetical protein
MLVYTIKDIYDYGNLRRLQKGTVCIVYAVEYVDNSLNKYAVFPLKPEGYDYSTIEQPDPLFFESQNFEVLFDDSQHNWITGKPYSGSLKSISVKSFPEWFLDGTACRVHDWDLEQSDYDKLVPVFNKYNTACWNYIHNEGVDVTYRDDGFIFSK